VRSAVLTGKREIKVLETNDILSKDGSVVIEVTRAGICGSDIHNWELGLPENLIMGHEFCGIVLDPGARGDLKIGDKITALPISPCGACSACLSGNHQYCPNTWTNAVGLSLTNPGAYALKTSVRPDLAIKIPNSISDDEIAMVEPVAVGLHAIHLANIKIGDNVLVIGAGIIGDICAMFAKMNGASYVAISETNEKRGKKAVKLNCADEWFNAKNDDFLKKVKRVCPFGYDVVIDCSGNSNAVTSSLSCVKANGTVVMVGVSVSNISIPSSLIVMQELNIKGAIAYTVKEFVKCIELIRDKKIDVLKFVDDIVSLDEVQKSFERLTKGDDAAIKILIDPKKQTI